VLKALVPALAIFAIVWVSFGATPTKSPKRRHRSTSSATHTPAKRTSKAVATRTTTAAHRKGKSSKRPSRSYQQSPSPERYKEIQQALAGKGYLQGEATGEWGPDSVEALKRFQTDQNLTSDGKISSLSLIALGLGPKRLTAKSDAPPSGTPALGTTAPGAPAPPSPTPVQ
jgi:Putative peptidoglycan binding domain